MKNPLFVLLLLIPLAAGAANPRSISITIQENGRAQISETHDVPPPDASGTVRIAPVPSTLLPTSVNADPVERGQSIEFLSQRFAFDLRDSDSLFRAYLGREITARLGDRTLSGRLASLPDWALSSPSLMLATDGQPVQLIPNLNDLDSVDFPPQPDVARIPTLLWRLSDSLSAPVAVRLHYAADGLTWSATHEAILAPDGRSIALSTRARIQNLSDREFANARIRLALTDKGRHAPLVPSPGDPRADRTTPLRYSADGLSWIPERVMASASIVATYDIPQPLTLPVGGEIRAGLAAADSLAVDTRHIYDGVRFDRYQRNRRTDWSLGTEFSPAIETHLLFRNPLEQPLPPGEFRLLRGNAERALEWIGSDWLPPLAPGQEARLNLGPAAGLSGQRIRTGYTELVPFKSSEESFEITLENQTEQDRTITVVEHLYRGDSHEIAAANTEHQPGETPNSIRFEVPVRARSQRTITYTVRYSW